ncbi:MAG: cell wall metabolism sensor histidine kinase WalK [Alicyclobacillaceae bacterium]|uniref:cell wall metabolism sensor histidine kinase WalK n=1 Tax=Alicyclobacillus sp. SP_1 TaxID=2942475 RepID=UPI00215875B4|nr:cell wall metabolism sensor histidine kinase WalK [Alicyclobacillus sp. SP_1]MCY0889018.1 cell wall metabolism sensor histidine kinase WalK [Alicyclobacillaceae bacterium]
MIRNSIVSKLWITIVGMVVVVLALLAILLQQFFANFVQQQQTSTLTKWAVVLSQSYQTKRESLTPELMQLFLKKVQDADVSYAPNLDTRLTERSAYESFNPVQRREFATGLPVSLHQTIHGTPEIAVYIRLKSNGTSLGMLAIRQKTSVLDSPLTNMRNLILFDMLLGVVLTTGLAFVVSKNLSRPLIEMNQAAERMADGNFESRVNVVTSDEVGRLGTTFNALAGELSKTIHALSVERDQLTSILESLQDGVLATNADGGLTLANLPALRILRQMSLSERGVIDTSQLPEYLQSLLYTVQDRGESMAREMVWQNRNITVVVTPLREPGGNTIRGVLIVLRDVTDERQMDRLRKDFLANVSHELRTPLSMLQGYSEALLDDIDEDPQSRRELMNIIHEETLRMKRLVNDLLNLASLESGQFQMNFAPVEANAFIRRISRKFYAIAADKSIEFVVQVEKHPILFEADEDRLEQVFTNLLDNAFRHTHAGRVALSVAQGAQHVHFEVSDTGTGVPAEDLPFIFERFYKADKARTRGSSGTGLGLAIARHIVMAHGGDIVADSVPERGTSFTIVIPLRKQL